MKKRIASLFLTVLLACTMVLSMTVTTSAASLGEHYIEFASGNKLTQSFDLTYEGVTYYHLNFLISKKSEMPMNYNCIINVTRLEEQDPDAYWYMYVESEDGSYEKGFFEWRPTHFEEGSNKLIYYTFYPDNIPAGNFKLCVTCNDTLVLDADMVAAYRHFDTRKSSVSIADETIEYGEDLHFNGVLYQKYGEQYTFVGGYLDITLSDGSVHTINLSEISDGGIGVKYKFNFTISGLEPGEYSITSAKFYGSDCYEDAEIPFSGTCVVEGNGLGSILSEGYPEIVFGVGGLAVGFFAAMLIFRKKKVSVSSASAEDEE